uniref:Uncharacterized protein n=1 Tax=Oryza barthii TaxID=65489 RepID=A0A0D3F4Z7_9ORYZ
MKSRLLKSSDEFFSTRNLMFGVIYIVYINAPQPYRIAARRLRDLSLMQHLVRGDCDRASYNILVDAYEDSEATFKQLKQQVWQRGEGQVEVMAWLHKSGMS